jgi:hypothetical protein
MIGMTRDIAIEALDCVAVRARWYETRGMVVPQRTMRALQELARYVGTMPVPHPSDRVGPR